LIHKVLKTENREDRNMEPKNLKHKRNYAS
jgi:hypothetical protein